MARMGDTTVARGLALAISFLLLGVASDDFGHAITSTKGHSSGLALLKLDAPPAAPASAPPHDAPECPTCRAARSANVLLSGGSVCTTAVAGVTLAVSLPETPSPAAPRHRADPARAPPARLVV